MAKQNEQKYVVHAGRLRGMTQIALFAAVIAVLSQISIPLPSGVPITLQTFAVALCGFLLGTKRGTLAVFVYLMLGLCGVPVFSAFGGGVAVLFGKTGGFLIGFLPFAALCGIPLRGRFRYSRVLSGLVGLAVCHLCGGAMFSALTGTPFGGALLLVSVPYLLKDILCVVAAFLFADRTRKYLNGRKDC